MSKTIDELVQKVQYLNDSLQENKTKVNGLGIDFNELNHMVQECERLQQLGAQADDLRAQLKGITAEANQTMDGIKERFYDIKKIIKSNFEQSHWMGLGVQDKR